MLNVITRTLKKIAFVGVVMFAGVAQAQNYQDWWWNENQSGHGFSIGQQTGASGESLFVAWYTYDNNGFANWYVLPINLVGQSGSGDVYQTAGPKFNQPYNASLVTETKVGTARITFTDLYNAVFEYTISGVSGTIAIKRFNWAGVVHTGSYYSQCVGGSNCADGVPNYAVVTQANVSFDGTTIRIVDTLDGGGECTFTGTVSSQGALTRALGNYVCNTSMESGRWESDITYVRTTKQTVMSRNDLMTRTRGGCTARQTVVGAVAYTR